MKLVVNLAMSQPKALNTFSQRNEKRMHESSSPGVSQGGRPDPKYPEP